MNYILAMVPHLMKERVLAKSGSHAQTGMSMQAKNGVKQWFTGKWDSDVQCFLSIFPFFNNIDGRILFGYIKMYFKKMKKMKLISQQLNLIKNDSLLPICFDLFWVKAC